MKLNNFKGDINMKNFYNLTQRGQARRLRKIVFQALEQYNFKPIQVRLITNETNGIFRIDTADKKKYVMRITSPDSCHSLDEILSEMLWLQAITRDTDLGVPVPIANKNGQLVTSLELEGIPKERHCALFSWVPGPNLSEKICPENLNKLGQFTAQLHIHGRHFSPNDGFKIRKLNKIFPYSDPDFPDIEPVVLFDDNFKDIISSKSRSLFQMAVSYIQNEYDKLFSDSEGLGLIHNDMHQWNIKVYRGRIYAIDFEDMMWGYPIQEIATTFYYYREHEEYEKLSDAYMRGYCTIGNWPKFYSEQIDTFMASKNLMLANYLLTSNDPEYEKMAPEYLRKMEANLRKFLKQRGV